MKQYIRPVINIEKLSTDMAILQASSDQKMLIVSGTSGDVAQSKDYDDYTEIEVINKNKAEDEEWDEIW